MAMSGSQGIFRYKTVKGPLHKLPVMLKFFMFLLLSIFCMSLPPLQLTAGIIIAVLTAFMCKFTIREQLTDLKPAALYGVLMYALSVFSNIFEINFADIFITHDFSAIAALILFPRPDFLRITLRLVLIIQLSALLFRSTSAMELRHVFRCRIAENIALFLSFIPEIFSNWSNINLAWKIRGGKRGLAKIKTTIFVLISLSMEKAAVKAKALSARGTL